MLRRLDDVRRTELFLGSTLAILLFLLSSLTFADEGAEADASPGPPPACAVGVGEATALLVQTRYDGIRDFQADFGQVSQSASFAGEPLMDSKPKSGRVVFAKPGKMRWTYEAPDESVVVSDGKILWIHDVEGGTATRLEVTAGYLSGAALQFLLGDGRILDEFDVRATACSAERISLDLVPKTDASYERLGLVANASSGDIEETSIVDLFGNRTEIRFRNVEVNRAPAPHVFDFNVPEGVEFIDYADSQSD